MKVLFLEKKLRTDKLGILYLSRILKDAGHTVDLIQTDIENIKEYMEEKKPDFVMYSVMSGDHNWFHIMNSVLKSQYDFISVMGGPHFTFFPEDGIKDNLIDFVVQGPGEEVILDIVEGRIKEKFVMGHLPDIPSIPNPDRSILYKYDEFGQARMKRFIAGRYCLYSCTYCFNHLFKKIYREEKKQFFQRVSPNKMIEEIKEVWGSYPLELIYFNDDDLAADKEWILEFSKKFKKQIGLEYCGSIRANSVNYEILKIMADSGCVFLNIALESAIPKTQKYLRRGFITNEQIEDACRWCDELGIKVRLQNMIGLPVDNPLEDALATLEMNQKINPTDSWVAIFQPYPRTDIWYDCIEKGLMTEDTQAGVFYKNTVLDIPNAEKINRLHKWWFFAIKYQLPLEFIEILLEISLSDEQKELMQEYRWEVAKGLLYGM